MPTFVSELEPQAVWRAFDRILATPRPSKREAALRDHLRALAAARGFEARQDEFGNLVVAVPATAGHEKAPVVVLQSHLDMVAEKNAGVMHDFERDPIVPRREGDWLYATGTTLGSDNGIGVAAMMALMEGADGAVHGPLELLYTVEEEIGLNGAAALDPKLVRGRTLLNLDTEEEGSLYVGCAGGAGCELTVPLDRMFGAEGMTSLRVAVAGLKGGHSGVDIHLQRGNSIAILARALHGVARESGLELASITGGNLTNAIPREAEAVVRVPRSGRAGFERALGAAFEEVRAELAAVDPGLTWIVEEHAEPGEVWDDASAARALALLRALPHGVARWSDDIPDLVETSSNLARVRTAEDGALEVHVSNRSSVGSALAARQRKVAAAAELAGGACEFLEGYPGWKPNLESPVLAALRRVHARELGKEPEVKAIHAGLECGVLGERLPGSDMVSLGPQIEFPHSPDERVLIPSVGRFWTLLRAVLAELA